jgi:hypothetical protein
MLEKPEVFSVKNSKHCLCGNTGSDFPQFPEAGTWKKSACRGHIPLTPFAFKKSQNFLAEFLIFLHECPMYESIYFCKILLKT